MVFYPITAWLIATLGWRTALAVFGGMLAVATVSLALLYREPPIPEAGVVDAAPVAADVWTLGRALRSARLWAAFTMTALGVIGYPIMATHQVAHALDRGFAATGAIVGVVQAGGGLGGAIGPFLDGWLFDVTGSYKLAFTAAGVSVAGWAVAAWMASRPVAVAASERP